MSSEIDQYNQFTSNYFTKFPEKPTKANTFQYTLRNASVSNKELKGEIIYICLQHLLQCACPDNIAYIIARKVSNLVIQEVKQDETEEEESKEYESSAVAEVTLQTIHTICQLSYDELMTGVKPLPPSHVYSACGIKNMRRKMEDHHIIITNLNAVVDMKDAPVTQFFGVYDGHGGITASNYAAKHLHMRYVENNCYDLKTCVKILDDEFCAKAHKEHLRCGTTAVVATITDSEINLAWVGDSQAVLVKNGTPIEVTTPHKPERADEKLRIEELGGCVVWFGAWRVNGTIAVSRAIGDADHKPYISGEADLATVQLNGDEEYLCLACDGLWDVFNGRDLVNLVADYMREGGDRKEIARHLCIKAKEKGSTDNITVVIVFLKTDIDFKNLEEEVKKEEVATEEDVSKQVTTAESPNSNNNSNSSTKSVQSPGPEPTDSMVQGVQMKPAEKIKIPHKLLVNFARNAQQPNVEKVQVIVTESSTHTMLPHTHYSPQRRRPHAYSKSPQRKSTTASETTRTSLSKSLESELVIAPSVSGDDRRSISPRTLPNLPTAITNSLSSTLKPLRPRTVL